MIFISIRTHILTQTHTETEKTLVVASVCLDMHGLLGQLIDPCKSVLMMFIEVERTWPIYLPYTLIYTSDHSIFYVYYVNTTHINRIYLV